MMAWKLAGPNRYLQGNRPHDSLDPVGPERSGALRGPVGAGWRDCHSSGNAATGPRLVAATPAPRDAEEGGGPFATTVLTNLQGKIAGREKGLPGIRDSLPDFW